MAYQSINTQCILLLKQKEDLYYVWYKFEVSVIADKTYLDKKGRTYPLWEPRYGVIKFKKTGTIENSTFEIIREESDPAFWEYKPIIAGCLSVLFRCKEKNHYPDNLHWACG